MTKKDIFLTGGAGFVGKNLYEQLSEKYNLYAPSHGELELEDTDAVEDYIKSHSFDAVIHAANWGGTRKKTENLENNVEKNLKFFFNVVRCKKYFKKFIQLGSGAEYDKLNYLPKMKESYFDNHIPVDSYGFYKYVCSKYIEKMDDSVVLRIFGCYGKYEDYEIRFISNAICKAIFDLPIVITNKNVSFDYLYINDLVKIIDHFIENNGQYKFYNVTPDKSIDLLTLAHKVRDISGKRVDILVKNPGENPEYSGDNTRLKEEIKNLKFTNIDDGIHELYAWYNNNKNALNYDKISLDQY
ncbi:MAG: NAD(P)-dependent oxidoreductase [Candidatus Micrarchaeota archaeon]